MKPHARRTLTLPSAPTSAAPGVDAVPALPEASSAGVTRRQDESEYGRLRHDLGIFFRRLEKEYEEAG